MVYRNDTERPMQSIACDPFDDFLVGTDWNGIIYFWKIKSNEPEEGGIELVKPSEWSLQKRKLYCSLLTVIHFYLFYQLL